jgi:flagellar protein FlaG
MDRNAKISPVVPVTPTAFTQPAPAEKPEPKASNDVEGSARYRLLIEEGPAKGSFVYKTLDSVTGEIVRQFPREQVLRLAEANTYDTGSVINTSA